MLSDIFRNMLSNMASALNYSPRSLRTLPFSLGKTLYKSAKVPFAAPFSAIRSSPKHVPRKLIALMTVQFVTNIGPEFLEYVPPYTRQERG
jgi:hypothetical protein